jgi:hypothetical protein
MKKSKQSGRHFKGYSQLSRIKIGTSYITISQAAEKSGYASQTIREWISTKKIPAFRKDKQVVILTNQSLPPK